MTQPLQTTPYVPPPTLYPTSVQLPFLKLGKSRFENGVDVSQSRVALATFTTKVPLPSLEAQRALFMAGACPYSYDGVRVHEAGFHVYPEGVAGSGITTGSGALTNATYGIVFVYEWEDAKGVLWRSAPSVPVSVALGANNALSCTVPHLRITDKMGAYPSYTERRGHVRIVGYRTAANGTTYYRDTPNNTSDGEVNNPGALQDAIWISELSDALLVKNEVLYVTGGGLENEAWPACTVSCMHQKRVFMVTQEEQNWIQYTDEIDERFLAPATSEVYRLPVPAEGGSVVGLASMDGKLIIFCQHQIYFVYGEGPNRLGQQNGYSLPESCSKTLGMMGGAHESIAVTPAGIWFLASTNGLRLLTRGLQIAETEDGFVGIEADAFFDTAYVNVRAHFVPTKSQVRWYVSSSNIIVVWDYARKQWSKHTNHASAGGSVRARGVFFHSDGTDLFQSDTTPGTSDAVAFSGSSAAGATSCIIETANIAVGGLQNFQRVYSMMLLMQATTPGGSDAVSVTIEVAYDYSETFTETATVTLSGGSLTSPKQLEHKLGKQQCQAVRFRITWVQTSNPVASGNTTELLRLTGMSVSVGLKGRAFPLPSANRA